jgi:hypothetical protein
MLPVPVFTEEMYMAVNDDPQNKPPAAGEMIVYRTEDGRTEVHLRTIDGTVWLTQAEMAELFQTSPQAITQLIRTIYEDGELAPEATCKEFLQVRSEGARMVRRNLKVYRLEAILAVGYRARSPRGVQFRQWATMVLREYLVKGFAMNDKRLKDPQGVDYFDELLERIRDIRASERRFYEKVRDLFVATSTDYDSRNDTATAFFATIQNKMLFAIAGQTAREIVLSRCNAGKPNMGLTSWDGAVVRKKDINIAKNYLTEPEIKSLNRLITMFLDYAQDRAERRQTITMTEWVDATDRFLQFNERGVLTGKGRLSKERAEQYAARQYEEFDRRRRAEGDEAAGYAELEAIQKEIEGRKD